MSEFGRIDKRERRRLRSKRRSDREEEARLRRKLHELERENHQEERALRRELNHNDKPGHHKSGHKSGHKPAGSKRMVKEPAMETIRSTKSTVAGETLTLTTTLPDALVFERITMSGDDAGRLLSIQIGRRNVFRSTNGLAIAEIKATNLQSVNIKGVEAGKGDILTVTVQASDKDKIIDFNFYGDWLTPAPRSC